MARVSADRGHTFKPRETLVPVTRSRGSWLGALRGLPAAPGIILGWDQRHAAPTQGHIRVAVTS